MAKKSRPIISPRLARYLIGTLALLVIVAQSVLIWQLYARTDRQVATQGVKDMLIDAVRGLNVEPAVDPITGRKSVPAYRVVLPANTESHMYYRGNGDEPIFWLIDASNQSQAITKLRSAPSVEGVFKEVATVQMCSRQIVVNFSTDAPKYSDDKLTLKNTKKLKDGRTVYIYQNACPYGAESLLRDLEKIESY